MRTKYLQLTLFVLFACKAHADAHFDSLFAKSNVVVVGRCVHQNSQPLVLETIGNRQYVDFRIENVALGGIPVADSIASALAGDTLKRFSYLVGPGGESIWPFGVVLMLVRDTSDKNGWVLTNEVITQSSFNDVYVFFNRFTTYYTDAGFGNTSRIEYSRKGLCSIQKTFYQDGSLARIQKSRLSGLHGVTWETNYSPKGEKLNKSRSREKYARYGTKRIILYTWINGHPTLRRHVMKIID